MKIVYSNSAKPDQVQTDANKSLGGYLSSTPVLNGVTNNIFPSVSNQDLSLLPFEVRMLGVVNNSTSTNTSISVSFSVSEDSIFTYSFAISTPTVDDCGDLYELITSGKSLPYYSTFTQITPGESYSIDATIIANGSIGLWLKREFKATRSNKVSVLLNNDDCELWATKYDNFIAEESYDDTEDTFNIIISYSEEESSSSSS